MRLPLHPAVFSDPILTVIAAEIPEGARVLDPFAGTGKIHRVNHAETVGVELEPEWAAMHPKTEQGNALALRFDDESFDVIATSPTYGNRFADHHNAKDGSTRRSYTHDLGRALHEDNSGAMQWGHAYRAFHAKAWAEALRVLRPGGLFILNCKDHVRGGRVQRVTAWHLDVLQMLGLRLVWTKDVPVLGMRYGDNRERVDHETVALLEKP